MAKSAFREAECRSPALELSAGQQTGTSKGKNQRWANETEVSPRRGRKRAGLTEAPL